MRGHAANAIGRLRGRLEETLFPEVARSPTRLGRGEAAVLLLAFLALAVVLQLLRGGASYTLGSVWAEDGPVFLQIALVDDFFEAVFTPYADYLVLAPRLIGELGALAPLDAVPATMAIAAGTVIALSGLAVWFGSEAHIRNPYLRGALVAATILAPVASLEAIASGTYVGWYMLFATFWLLLWRPATTSGAALAGLFILFTALSSPGVLYFAPLAALRVLAARDRRDLLIVGSYAAGAAAQIPILLTSNEVAVEPAWSSDILLAYLQRVLDGALLGEDLGGDAWVSWGWPFLILLIVAATAGFAFAAWRSTQGGRYVAGLAIVTSVAMYLASTYQRAAGPALIWPDGWSHGLGGRYAIVPALLLLSAALVLIDRSPRPRRGPPQLPLAGIVAAAVVLLAIVTSFDVKEGPSRGIPSWDDALRRAGAKCAARPIEEFRVPTSPPGFGVFIPCSEIESAGYGPPAR